MKVTTIIMMALLSTLAFAETYKWTDDSGKVHYGDKPLHDSAVKVSSPKKPSLTQSKSDASDKETIKDTQKSTAPAAKESHHCAKSVLVKYDGQKDGYATSKRKCLEN